MAILYALIWEYKGKDKETTQNLYELDFIVINQ